MRSPPKPLRLHGLSSAGKKGRVCEFTTMEVSMQIVAAILSVALLMWVNAASAQSTYSLSVSRHAAVPKLSQNDIKKILLRASTMLRKKPAPADDVACNVRFILKGPVRTFASPATPEVDENNIAAVHRVDSDVDGVDFHVKV